MLLRLVTLLSRRGTREKQPWERGNSELITAGITDINFNVTRVNYHSLVGDSENITAGITDITFVVTKV
jgi:hypothetical protein